MTTDYSAIIKSYPPVITLEQLYQICHISKRKAKWLLETGRIPCQDSGKKTRRFKIRTEDVVTYLTERTSNPDKYKAPNGMFNSAKDTRTLQCGSKRTGAFAIDASCYHAYISNLWYDLPDALTTSQIHACTGISKTTINQWLIKAEVEGVILYQTYIASKESVINQVVKLTLHSSSRLSPILMELALSYITR